jgi:hypothetical protein
MLLCIIGQAATHPMLTAPKLRAQVKTVPKVVGILVLVKMFQAINRSNRYFTELAFGTLFGLGKSVPKGLVGAGNALIKNPSGRMCKPSGRFFRDVLAGSHAISR